MIFWRNEFKSLMMLILIFKFQLNAATFLIARRVKTFFFTNDLTMTIIMLYYPHLLISVVRINSIDNQFIFLFWLLIIRFFHCHSHSFIKSTDYIIVMVSFEFLFIRTLMMMSFLLFTFRIWLNIPALICLMILINLNDMSSFFSFFNMQAFTTKCFNGIGIMFTMVDGKLLKILDAWNKLQLSSIIFRVLNNC